MLEINRIQLEFNLFDADMNAAYEEAYENAGKELEKAKEETRASEQLRIMCIAIKECFDFIFGAGTGDEVCGNNLVFLKCIDAYEAMTDEAIRQRKVLDEKAQKITTKYQGNRTQRRK